MSFSGNNTSTPAQNEQPSRGSWRGRGRGRPHRRGRGGKQFGSTTDTNAEASSSTENRAIPQKPNNPRPTHFLALPLHNHPTLSSAITSFHIELFKSEERSADFSSVYTSRGKPRLSSLVQGLDSTILIDPIRMHMTLGVIALESDEAPQHEPSSTTTASEETPTVEAPIQPETEAALESSEQPPPPQKTVASALELLKSLQPQIAEILDGETSVQVPLDRLDVLKTERIRPKKPQAKKIESVDQGVSPSTSNPTEDVSVTAEDSGEVEDIEEKVGAGVLYLGPAAGYHKDESGKKLKQICDLVHKTFKEAKYLTDTRPLKLHCTILNCSHRKPKRRLPFSYSDIVQQPACQLLVTGMPLTPESPPYIPASITRQTTAVPIQLGAYPVRSIQLWRMGSRGPNCQSDCTLGHRRLQETE